MVDRDSREMLFNLLSLLGGGALRGAQFEQFSRIATGDAGVRAIQWAFWLWCEGTDSDHQRIDAHEATKDLLHRCLVFLHSNREYAWPRWRMMVPSFLRDIGTGWDSRYWPFRTPEELRQE